MWDCDWLEYDEWVEKYKPIKNPFTGGIFFETYGEAFEFVKKQDNHHIWTNIDTEGWDTIDAGYFLANRCGYYITEVAWENFNSKVILEQPEEEDEEEE